MCCVSLFGESPRSTIAGELPGGKSFLKRMVTPFTIGILVFHDVEELDFIGPLEVFGVARENGAPLKTVLVGKNHAEMRAHFGLTFKPDVTFASCPPLDLLMVPGGPGARGHVRHDGNTLEFLKRH